MISNNKISNLVATQLPFFVRNDHENFVAFLEAYYEWLEQANNTVNVAKSMKEQLDVDQTDIFIDNFYNNFLPLIPEDTVADKRLILKHVQDFYKARGTEKSIRFLMRVLFNEDVEFYYPQRDILRASAGKWYVEKSIKIDDIRINGVSNTSPDIINRFISRKITGVSSNAHALVEKVDTYYEGGALVRELKISGQVKEFDSGEQITATFEENGVVHNITANLFSGSINTVELLNSGTGYKVGDTVKIEGGDGTGASIIVSSVTSGNLTTIGVLEGGAGFQVGSNVTVTGGGGTGANAAISEVNTNAFYHPNTYNVVATTISQVSTTPINSVTYPAALNSANINVRIADAVSYFRYANTGPITSVILYSAGSGYSTRPTISAQANTRVRNLGILGRMKINNGGRGYRIGDTITFVNGPNSYGTGAAGRVRNVNTAASNAISEVEFVNVPGHITGGSGYDQFNLPKVVVTSTNTSANGANVQVTSLLGFGESLVSVGSTAGSIETLSIISRGTGYTVAPTLNLAHLGDGTAQARATIITGSYTYPGRYLNDDGHLSSYNFLENRDYYQPYSYVLKLKKSLEKYRQALKTLIHPSGMKVFGENLVLDEGATLNVSITSAIENVYTTRLRTYTHFAANANTIIYFPNHGLQVNNTVYLDWQSGNVSGNTTEGEYTVRALPNANTILVFNSQYAGGNNIVQYPNYDTSSWGKIELTGTATLTANIDDPDGGNRAVRFACSNNGIAILRVTMPSFTPTAVRYVVSFWVRSISGTGAVQADWGDDANLTFQYQNNLVANNWVRVRYSGIATASAKTFFDLYSDANTNRVLDFYGLRIERDTTPTGNVLVSKLVV